MSYSDVDFGTYIYKVLKQIHPESGLSGDALSSLNNYIRILIKKITDVVNTLITRSGGRKTISAREIQTAVRLCFPENLAKYAVKDGVKAVTKYNSTKDERAQQSQKGKLAPISKSKVAGITFPVTRVENIMMELSIISRKSESSAVYLAAVLEYVIAEILEVSGNVARDYKKVRITPRHIKLGILNDNDLSELFKGTIMSGGVAPIFEAPKTKRSKVPKEEGKDKTSKKESSKKETSKKSRK